MRCRRENSCSSSIFSPNFLARACPAWPGLQRAPRGQGTSVPRVAWPTSRHRRLASSAHPRPHAPRSRRQPTMVNIHTHTLSFWRARRRRLSVGLVVGHTMELTLADMSPLVDAYRRAHREVTLSLARSRRVTASRFNMNSFCSSEALSLFHFLPSDIGRLVDLLHVEDAMAMTKYAVTPVERANSARRAVRTDKSPTNAPYAATCTT